MRVGCGCRSSLVENLLTVAPDIRAQLLGILFTISSTHVSAFFQANAIVMKVQSNLAASEKFFVDEQTRQSMVSLLYWLTLLTGSFVDMYRFVYLANKVTSNISD